MRVKPEIRWGALRAISRYYAYDPLSLLLPAKPNREIDDACFSVKDAHHSTG
jgi:hypothetical protein